MCANKFLENTYKQFNNFNNYRCMTTKELRDRTRVEWCGYGQYKVRIMYRGKEYKCHSNNSIAYDRLDDPDHSERWELCGYNNHRAWQSFYDECKRKNCLI